MGGDNAGDKVLHITSGVHTEADMKVEKVFSDTVWYSKEKYAEVTDYSEATIGGSWYWSTYTFADLSGTLPSDTVVITIAKLPGATEYIDFDAMDGLLRPGAGDLGLNFGCIHANYTIPDKVYRFWVKYTTPPFSEIKVDRTGVYLDSTNTIKKRLLIVPTTSLPTGFVGDFDKPFTNSSGDSTRFIVTSDSIASVEVTGTSLEAYNSTGAPIVTSAGRELTHLYSTSWDLRNGGGTGLTVSSISSTAIVGKRETLTVTPDITGQTATSIILDGKLYSVRHLAVEESIADDGYGNKALLGVRMLFDVPSVGSTVTNTIIDWNLGFLGHLYARVVMKRTATNTFRFDFYHYCPSSGASYCKVGTSGGFVGNVVVLS